MKKFYMICALAIACTLTQTVNAQSLLKNLLGAAAGAATSSNTNTTSGQDVLGTVLNNVVSSTTSNDNSTGNLIGNLIAKVTGSATTTQANLIGNWAYTSPAVQFESKSFLANAGGTTIATKCENKLAGYYKIVGIKSGSLKFSFAEDGSCQYGVGSKMLSGTYVFDNSAKTVTITTMTGQSVKAYVTISGNNMALCFDGKKLLTLFTAISAKFSALSTVSTLAGQYDGMKVGFKFSK